MVHMSDRAVLGVLSWFLLLHAASLYFFTKGFLLTRVELSTFSKCSDVNITASIEDFPNQRPTSSHEMKADFKDDKDGAAFQSDNGPMWRPAQHEQAGADAEADVCWAPPAFRRAVIIIVDAMRFDFVSNSTEYPSGLGPWVGQMAALERLAKEAGPAAALFKFVADPPTTSLQRLKGLTTGGLPTFIDAGASFGAHDVAEDNLILQLVRRGRYLSFMGDDTWMSVFPTLFAESKPFPSLVVKDINTVDDGVLAEIFSALKKPHWDVLIAHFLGVDHAGHTFEVNSATMLQKLRQMNQMVEDVAAALRADAEPGGAHRETLLVVMGDHAQTLAGDHGGGTPEETDTVLLAMSMRPPPVRLPPALRSAPCNIDEDEGAALCIPVLSQIDFAPTLALLLGLPIPYGSVGAICPELWSLSPALWPALPAASEDGNGSDCDALLSWMRSYSAALGVNSWQVQKYMDEYSRVAPAPFPAHLLSRLRRLYASAQALDKGAPPAGQEQPDTVPDQKSKSTAAGGDDLAAFEEVLAIIGAHKRHLAAAADLARAQWTQFRMGHMAAGLALLLLGVLAQGLLLVRVVRLGWLGGGLGPGVVLSGASGAAGSGQSEASSAEERVLGSGSGSGSVPSSMRVTPVRKRRKAPAAANEEVAPPPAAGSAEEPQPTVQLMPAWRMLKLGMSVAGMGALIKQAASSGMTGGRLQMDSFAGLLGVAAALALFIFFQIQNMPPGKPPAAKADLGSARSKALSWGWGLESRSLGAVIVTAVHALSLFSNSFILAEGQVVRFLMATLGVLFLRVALQRGSGASKALFLLGVNAALTGVGLNSTFKEQPAHLPPAGGPANAAFLEAALAGAYTYVPIAAFVLLLRRHFPYGQKQSRRGPLWVTSVIAPLTFLVVAASWIVQDAPAGTDGLSQEARDAAGLVLPRAVYMMTGVMLVTVLATASGQSASWQPLNVYGLARERVVAVATAGGPALVLLLGRQGPLVLLLAVMEGASLLTLQRQPPMLAGQAAPAGAAMAAGSDEVHWAAGIEWNLLALLVFFSTGHRCTFDGLHYSAAFTGFDEFNFVRQGALLAAETFGASHVLPPVLLPLLALQPLAAESPKAPAALCSTEPCTFPANLLKLSLAFGLARAVSAAATVTLVTVERRHLMVWSLFAPKYVFDGIGLLLIDTCLLLGAAFSLRALRMTKRKMRAAAAEDD